MENRWTLHVENLGRIKKADVTVAPLNLFVGDNNSGKSYLMSLIYTLLNVRFYRQKYDLCQDSAEYQWCENWLKSAVHELSPGNSIALPFQKGTLFQFETLLNQILSKNLKKIALIAFNTKVPIAALSVRFPYVEDTVLRIYSEGTRENFCYRFSFVRPAYRIRTIAGGEEMDQDDYASVLCYILEYFLQSNFKYRSFADVIFLPTSRTGFLLTYPSLVKASFSETLDAESEFEEEPSPKMHLTRPCSDFLKNIVAISPQNTSNMYQTTTDFIEEKLISGKINVTNLGTLPYFTYQPTASNENLPMQLSSGVVTEVAPLLLMLKYHRLFETLFIEEPEISLHPALQQKMAQVLIRLVNQGTPVFASTHSDTILQHLNNMIKLSNLPEARRKQLMENYQYEDADIISANDVAMYQFDVDEDGRTSTKPLTFSEYGFIVPTFNDTLRSLLQETREFKWAENGEDNG